LTQEKLAGRIGVTFQQLQKYEKGTNRIGASRLHRIAEALGVSPMHFFADAPRQLDSEASDGFSDAADQSEAVTAWMATQEALELMEGFTGIRSPKVKRSFVGLCQAIAKAEKRARGELPPEEPEPRKRVRASSRQAE
jgi:transcriptional regulator with XRE-family HTH domain